MQTTKRQPSLWALVEKLFPADTDEQKLRNYNAIAKRLSRKVPLITALLTPIAERTSST
ncbi:hypothetical protein [Oceanisphaera sp. IT1-181]|uniref:hypothetical protein n=1 Tax=Oceanisphaera sp. IT1-181 TaxID=3081199 RepID=UPI0029C9C65D|nr:hypothetical protein [Oceanisphaera sp. IT1-181]